MPVWYALLAVLISTLAVAGAGIWYTHHTQQQADRRWCELLDVLGNGGPPAETDRGRSIAREVEQLRTAFGCSP